MTNYQTVLSESHQQVLLCTLNRPQALNAFNGDLFDDLAQAFVDAATNDAVKVMVLTGAGRAFSAGADLAEMGRGSATPPRYGFAGLCRAILDFPKPLVLAINGLGVGLGATLCGLADLVFMAESARLRCPFSSLGLTAEAGSTLTFPALMGRQKAAWFLLSAEWLSAKECVDAGLALKVCGDEELLAYALGRAQLLAALPGASLRATKRLMQLHSREVLLATFDAENRALGELVGKSANAEAIKAFREKRPADFSRL